MGQYWQIFNITQGKVIPIHDGSKYCEKSISIDVLIMLLQNEWKNNKIVMIGDYDDTEISKEFTKEFLDLYELTSKETNLYDLDFKKILPYMAYESSFLSSSSHLHIGGYSEIFYIQRKILSLKNNTKINYNTILFMINKYSNCDNIIEYKPHETDDEYAFINHTKKEYIFFNKPFFYGFYSTRTKKALTMTLIQYNHLVQDIVLGLITNNSEFKDKLTWHGRFAGHNLSFEKMETFTQHSEFSDYINISELFIGESINKNTIYRDTSNILYTENPKADLDICDEEEE